MKFGDVIVLFLLLGVLGFGLYVLWLYLPVDAERLYRVTPIPQENFSIVPSNVQFYPDMRYSSSEITYHIEPACDSNKQQNILKAFDFISGKTVLRFVPSDSSAELVILCSEVAPTVEQRNHFIAGEGGPTTIINASRFYVIVQGKVSLYRDESCDEPHVTIHEILHALGFDHNQNPSSIMYPVTSCKQVVDSYIIDSLNELYNTPSLPDLILDDLSGTKSGKYLTFHALVSNDGLKDAYGVNISISVDGEFVKEFPLGTIPLGTKKFLDVNNLQVPRGSQDIVFTVVTEDEQAELSSENNRAVLSVG